MPAIGLWKEVWVADSLHETPVNNNESNWHMLLMNQENSKILLFLFRIVSWRSPLSSNWVNVISIPPVGSRDPALWVVVRWSRDSYPCGRECGEKLDMYRSLHNQQSKHISPERLLEQQHATESEDLNHSSLIGNGATSWRSLKVRELSRSCKMQTSGESRQHNKSNVFH